MPIQEKWKTRFAGLLFPSLFQSRHKLFFQSDLPLLFQSRPKPVLLFIFFYILKSDLPFFLLQSVKAQVPFKTRASK